MVALEELVPPDPDSAGLIALAAAQVALDRDDLASAGLQLDEAGTTAVRRLPAEPDVEAVQALIRARAALAGGDITGARSLARLVRERGLDPLAAGVLEADIELRAGDVPLAAAALAGPVEAMPGGPARDTPDRQRADQVLVRARLLLADGDPAGVLKTAGECLDGPGAAAATLRDRVTALLGERGPAGGPDPTGGDPAARERHWRWPSRMTCTARSSTPAVPSTRPSHCWSRRPARSPGSRPGCTSASSPSRPRGRARDRRS